MRRPSVPDAAVLACIRNTSGVAYSSLNDIPEGLVMLTRDRLQAALPALLAANGGGGSPTPYEVRRDALYAAAMAGGDDPGAVFICRKAAIFAEYLEWGAVK